MDFGISELDAALAARNLHIKYRTELSLNPPQTFSIEPYVSGSARISGGDLRGLMYGLLEAAAQIRETGRFKKTQSAPQAAIRGIHAILPDPNFQEWYTSEGFWRDYFKMLAANRFNRFVLAAPLDQGRNLRTLHFIAQTAAEYGIDFTLDLDHLATYSTVRQVLTECPSIRSIEIAANSADREEVAKAIAETGHRIMLDLRGTPQPHADPAIPERIICEDSDTQDPGSCSIDHLSSASARQLLLSSDPDYVSHAVALLAARSIPGFEIDVFLDDPAFKQGSLFYVAWGQYSYDPKFAEKEWPLEVARRYGSASPALVDAYHQVASILLEMNPGVRNFIASPREAVENRLNRIASAKQTPLDHAALLVGYAHAMDTDVGQAGAKLDKTTTDQFQGLSQLAREKAAAETSGYQAALAERTTAAPPALPKPLPRPTFLHTAPTTVQTTQPLTLTLRRTLRRMRPWFACTIDCLRRRFSRRWKSAPRLQSSSRFPRQRLPPAI